MVKEERKGANKNSDGIFLSQGSSFSWNQSNLTERLNGKGLLSKGFRPSSKLLLFLRLGKHCVFSPKIGLNEITLFENNSKCRI